MGEGQSACGVSLPYLQVGNSNKGCVFSAVFDSFANNKVRKESQRKVCQKMVRYRAVILPKG